MEEQTLIPGRAGTTGGWSVMLVDDDPSTTEMFRLGLEFHGFEVAVAGSGDELFETLGPRIPDVIVLDYELPGDKGDVVLQKIRLDERTRALPVFMLSNFPSTVDGAIDRVFTAGAVAWLQKAHTPPRLLAEKLVEALSRANVREGV
jgi:two-component system, OmpR family, phosphate regulon response regulator PhoB